MAYLGNTRSRREHQAPTRRNLQVTGTIGGSEDQLNSLTSELARKLPLGTQLRTDGTHEIQAMVPESELVRYVIDLRSSTGGRGSFSTAHDHYDVLPDHLVAASAQR